MVKINRQALSFGVVGVINTLFDFIILNVLSLVLGVPKIPANIISATTVMIFSFFANQRVVFGEGSRRRSHQVVLFFAFTMIGLYVWQSLIFYAIDNTQALNDFVYNLAEFMQLDRLFSREFLVTNATKAIATVVSMLWNYYTYKKFVFNNDNA